MSIVTLTTDNGNFEIPEVNLLDKAMNNSSNGKAKTVASKLVQNWRILIKSECNVRMFANFIRNGISTRDVQSFVSKQAKLRKIHKDSSEPLSKAAIRSKLNDACAFVSKQKRVVFRLKIELLKAFSNKRFKQKKVLDQIKVKIEEERKSQVQNDMLKL